MAATLEINYQKSLALSWVCLSLQIQTQRDKTDQAFWLDHHRPTLFIFLSAGNDAVQMIYWTFGFCKWILSIEKGVKFNN